MWNHGGCNSFECKECGNKVLLSYSCKGCYEECDYEEVMRRTPSDGLCSVCHKHRGLEITIKELKDDSI